MFCTWRKGHKNHLCNSLPNHNVFLIVLYDHGAFLHQFFEKSNFFRIEKTVVKEITR